MSHKKDSSESSDTGGYIESGYYDDDFEKDLEWLINEEEKGIPSDTQVVMKYYVILCQYKYDIQNELIGK